MSNYHTHSIEDYQFTHGHHRIMSSGKYIALHPHFLGRPLTHEEMDFNLLYAEQTLAGFRIFGSNVDLTLSDDDLGKSLLFHKIASNDDDFTRYTAAGYTEGQYIWIPDCCGGTPIDCSTFQVSSITATDTGGYSCGDFVVDSITATDSGGSDDCISFVVDSIVATDSEGDASVSAPPPITPTPTATPEPTATSTPEPTETVDPLEGYYTYYMTTPIEKLPYPNNQSAQDLYCAPGETITTVVKHISSNVLNMGNAAFFNPDGTPYTLLNTDPGVQYHVLIFRADKFADRNYDIGSNTTELDLRRSGGQYGGHLMLQTDTVPGPGGYLGNVTGAVPLAAAQGWWNEDCPVIPATPTPTPTPTFEIFRWALLHKVINPWNEDPSARCEVDETTDYYAEWIDAPSTGRYVSGPDGECYKLRARGVEWTQEEFLEWQSNNPGAEINVPFIINSSGSTECDCGLPPTPTPTPTPTPNPTELSHLVYATEFNLNGEWWSTESYGPGVDPAITGQRREVYVNQIYSDYYDNTDGSAVALTFGNELTQFNQPENYANWLMNSFVGWPQSRWPERKAFKIQNISDLANFKYNYDSNVTEFPLSVTPKTGLAYLGEGIGQLEINMPLYASDGSGYGNLPSTGAILVSQTEGGKYSSDPGQTYELPQGNFEDEVNNMQSNGTSLRYVIYENWIVKRVMNVAPGSPYGAAPDPTPTPTPTPTATPTPTPTATPTATPTPTATLPPAPPAQFNWVVSTDVDSTNRVNYIEENLENDPYGVWASNEELQLRHYQYPGISFNYFPVEAGQSYYIKLEENNNPNGRFTISSVTGKNATNSVYLFNNDPAVIYTIDSVWNKATDSTRPDVAFLNNNNQAVDNQCAYDNEGLVKIYNKVDTNNGTDSTLCDANGYLNSANYIKIDVPANASPGEEFTIGWGGLQYWPHWAQGQNRITDTEWVDVRQITPAQDRGSIQFRVVENPTQPTVTPTPLPADNKLPISLIRSIGTLGNVADSTYSDTQAFLISKNYASPGSLTGVNERTSGNPYDPQTGDILYDDVSWSDELNPLPNGTFVFVKSVPLGTNEWFWITTDSNGIMTVTQL